jgi:hypothetical protein
MSAKKNEELIATENTEKNLTAKIHALTWLFSVISVLSVAEVQVLIVSGFIGGYVRF